MRERVTGTDVIAVEVIKLLRVTYPEVIERWDNEIFQALLDGEPSEEWPDYYNTAGALNWLDSEVSIAGTNLHLAYFEPERVQRDYCASCAEVIRSFTAREQSPQKGEL